VRAHGIVGPSANNNRRGRVPMVDPVHEREQDTVSFHSTCLSRVTGGLALVVVTRHLGGLTSVFFVTVATENGSKIRVRTPVESDSSGSAAASQWVSL
jgi:hypothetical protein